MTELQPPRHLILRRIGAVLAGLLAIFVLSLVTDALLHAAGLFPSLGQSMSDQLFPLATAYRVVYAVAGCYITARLAPDRPMAHALMLGIVGVILSTVGAAVTWNYEPPLGPHWYSLALIAQSLPCAWLGGWLRVRQSSGEREIGPSVSKVS
jgi:multisubunit Na+/H+ antiporter MnhB subunit